MPTRPVVPSRSSPKVTSRHSRTSYKELDFSREESVHADVVGGLRRHWCQRSKRLVSIAGLWVVGLAHGARLPKLENHPMTKSHPVDEPRSVGERTKRQRPPKAAHKSIKANAPKRQTRNKSAAASRYPVKPAAVKTKQQTCLDLLSRAEGATVEELQEATGWQQHSARGFLAGAVKKKLGLPLLSEKPDAGPRRYRVASTV